MDLSYLIRVLLKRKWIILMSAILASLVTWTLTRNEPKNYRSNARFSTGFATPDEIKVSESDANMYDLDIRFNNVINTLESPSVVSLLSYQLILHDLSSPDPFRPLDVRQKQSSVYRDVDPALASKVFEQKLDTMSVLTSYKPDEKKLLEFLDLYGYGYKDLVRNILVFQVPRTDYIEINCTTENPELSAFIVNQMFTQFLRYYRGVRSTKSQESIDTLESIMDKKKQDLDEKNKLLRGDGAADVTTENTSKFDLITELEKASTEETSHQTEYYYELRRINQKLTALGVAASPAKPDAATPNPNNNEELIQARKAMNDAYTDYLKSNADKDKLAKYNQLKNEYFTKYAASMPVASGTTRVPDASADLLEKKNDLEVNIEASKEKVKDLEAKIASLKQSVSSSSAKSANVETLMLEAHQAEKDYLDAKQKYQNALDITSSSVNNFRQLQKAQPAIEPEPSKRMLVVAIAGAITFMSVIVIIVFLVYLDSSMRTPVIFANKVGLKLISMVNFMNLKNKQLQDIVAGKIKESDLLEHKRNNVFRESIRKLRYEIETSGKKIFLFTSTKKSQGKTTLIQALSFSLSMSHKRVLIIDTNFSNNDLTVQLEADPVLEKMAAASEGNSLYEKVIYFAKNIGSEAGEVLVIGSEGGDYTPSEILPRENLLSRLHELAPKFDFIFLEGPPLNDFSDSKELVQYVDGVVAIFSTVSTIKQIDKESIRFFTELNGKFTGSVLNMVDLENVNSI
jgi:polysaccharide biosynthesis transport protein